MLACICALAAALIAGVSAIAAPEEAAVLAAERARIEVIARVSPAVVCVLDETHSGGGSGVVIDPAGLGLTNFHVVAGMMQTRRGLGGLPDGKTYTLNVLGVDPTGDLAMFRLSGKSRFDCVELGDSDRVRVGDPVMAMGNPFLLAEDYKPTVTLGIVSGLHRYQWGAEGNRLVYTDCIQVDASINPGNSGGPLFDMDGRLIGINGRAAFEERGRVNVGLGFAISVNQIKWFIPDLQTGRLVEHGTLGATVADAGYQSVIFDRMLPESVAALAGLRVGDRLHSFAGRPIHSANQFLNILGTLPAGWPADMEYSRPPSTESLHVRVKLDALPVKMRSPLPATQDAAGDAELERAPASSPAAWASADVPSTRPSRQAGAYDKAIGIASPCVVKLYGAGVRGEHGFGSGVIVSGDGLVVTTLSLLLESDNVRAVTSDGRLYRAVVKYRDPTRQLALLQLAPQPEEVKTDPSSRGPVAPRTFARLASGTSKEIQPGDWVLALGNPFKVADGDEPVSVLRGVFSVRTLLDASHRVQDFPYRGEVLVVDAVTSNAGSAGGPLLDLNGNWIGLIGKAAWSNLTNTRLNYAMPIEEVAAFLNDARRGKPVESPATVPVVAEGKGYHGIRLFSLAYRQGLPFVDRVDLGSPAERAGVRKEDLIISANGVAIPNARAFERACDRLGPGDDLTLVVKRGETLIPLTLKLEKAAE